MNFLFPRYLLMGIALLVGLSGMTLSCGNGNIDMVGSGSLEGVSVDLVAQTPALLVEFRASEGTLAQTGDTLARLDTLELSMQREIAEGNQVATQATWQMALEGARSEDLAQADAAEKAAKLNLESAQRDYQRLDTLLRQNVITQKMWDDGKLRAEAAEQTWQMAKAVLDRTVRGLRRQEITQALGRRRTADAQLALARKKLADALIIAPFAGLVSTQYLQIGAYAAPGMPLLRLTRLDSLWVYVFVPEPLLPKLALGGQVKIKSDLKSDNVRDGVVRYLSPIAEFTPKNVQTAEERAKLVYKVKIALANPKGDWKIGQPVEVTF